MVNSVCRVEWTRQIRKVLGRRLCMPEEETPWRPAEIQMLGEGYQNMTHSRSAVTESNVGEHSCLQGAKDWTHGLTGKSPRLRGLDTDEGDCICMDRVASFVPVRQPHLGYSKCPGARFPIPNPRHHRGPVCLLKHSGLLFTHTSSTSLCPNKMISQRWPYLWLYTQVSPVFQVLTLTGHTDLVEVHVVFPSFPLG